jgi:hypothetical protein
MTNANPNLTSTVIADKNGKVTTVHKKSEIRAGSPLRNVPAPTLSGSDRTKMSNASRINRIGGALNSSLWKTLVKSKTQRWLSSSSPEQTEVLDATLAELDTYTQQEKFVFQSIVEPLTHRNGETGAIHELLTHRKAFASEWAIANEPRRFVNSLEPFIYGLREGRGDGATERRIPLDCGDESLVQENVALIRFAFELKERAHDGGFLPVYRVQAEVGSDTNYVNTTANVYDNKDLEALIREHADRVDDLIEFSVTQQTSDPQRLRALLEHEGHSSLTYGLL